MKTKKVFRALARQMRLPLSATTALLLSTAAAPGQAVTTTTTGANDEIVQLEKYNVTGSYIPYAADAPAVPIRIITAQALQISGIGGDLTDVLRKQVPQFVGSGNIGSNNANISGNWTNGASMLSLRNEPTLVLINGRRAAFAPVAATGGFTDVDLNLIPVSAVERIDILSDGASATYGSDAVSGVVNIILKKNFEGLEIGGGYKWATLGHWSERSARAITGFQAGKTSVTVSFEWLKSTPVFGNQRSFSANQTGMTYSIPGLVLGLYDTNFNLISGDDVYMPTGKPIPAGTSMTAAQLIAAGYYYNAATSYEKIDAFNLAPYVTLALGNSKTGLTASIEHKFNDKLSAFGDILYSTAHTYSQLAAQPITEIPHMTPGNLEGLAAPGELGNPFAGAYAYVRNRFVDYPRTYDSINESLRLLGGLRGDINKDWYWESAINYNIVQQDYLGGNVINRYGFANALASGAVNMFSVTQTPGALDGTVLGTSTQRNTSTLATWDARVNGAINDLLAAGPIQVALGVEARRETLKSTPDKGSWQITDVNDYYFSQPVLWDGAIVANPFKDRRDILAIFAQVRVPIVAPAQKIPGLYTMDLDLAARFEHYSDTSSSFVPKVQLRYLPLNNQLALRASYSQSFNAPTLFSLHAIGVGYTDSQGTITRADGSTYDFGYDQAIQYDANNPDLKPQKSRNFNLGVVYSPKAIKGLSLEANYFYIKRSSVVYAPSVAELLQDVELKGKNSHYAQYVRYGGVGAAGAAFVNPGDLVDAVDHDGTLVNVYVTNKPENIADGMQDGVDLSGRYTLGTKTAGSFEFQATGMWYRRYNIGYQFDPSTYRSRKLAGATTDIGADGTIPRWSANATVTWQYKEWTASLFGKYIPAVNTLVPPDYANAGRMASFASFDATVGHTFSKGVLKGLTMRAGCNNILNKMPPISPSQDVWTDCNTDISTYGYLGRVLYIDASYKF